MICETFDIKNENSQEYARLNTYLISHSDSIKTETRPLIILCPGGGYWFTSEREGEMLALQFVAAGFHAAILWYSVKPATFPTALLELAKSVELVRKHAKEWYVDPDKIVVEGCSAGGHLAASYGVFWHEDFVSNKLQVSKDILKPNGMILSYPVITSGEFAHRGSFNNLLRDQYTEEMLEKTSLEKQVNEYVPRAFIWHTYENLADGVASGFVFEDSNAWSLLRAIRRAFVLWSRPSLWRFVQRQAMAMDFSWQVAAKSYRELYYRLK